MLDHDDDFIGVGDVVEHRMNTDVFGIVIGIAGSVVYLRASPSLSVLAFQEWELQPISGDAPGEPEEHDNVVPFVLRASTKTKGAA